MNECLDPSCKTCLQDDPKTWNHNVVNCRHGRPECECQCIISQPLSSGRWDAVGSWSEAVQLQQEKATRWAVHLNTSDLYRAVTTMASDENAFTLYERKAILDAIAIHLWREIDHD